MKPLSRLEPHVLAIHRASKDRRWATPLDYFSWGRDPRHMAEGALIEEMAEAPVQETPAKEPRPWRKRLKPKLIAKRLRNRIERRRTDPFLDRYRSRYAAFDESYRLMSDDYSRTLFAELIAMKLLSEENMRLSSWSQDFVDSYEEASRTILGSDEIMPVYGWNLRKVSLKSPQVSLYTVATVLNLHLTGRLYRYRQGEVCIQASGGDTIIDAGVGFGDTTVYLSALARQAPGSKVLAVDILQEGLDALARQTSLNPDADNIVPTLAALADKGGEEVTISDPSPAATVTGNGSGRTVKTVTIDTLAEGRRVGFIKMDIEGSEVPALLGARETIRRDKPRLAISAYHKDDDLLVLPRLIKDLRPDYRIYLDCTTGFGGEAVLYCD